MSSAPGSPATHSVVGDRRLAAACLCLFVSGAVALLYEVCWIRRAGLVFGATSLALSTVLAVFFGGLALGSAVFGRLSRRVKRPLALFGTLEIALGVLAFVSSACFDIVGAAWGSLYAGLIDDPLLLSLARIPLVTLLVLPSSVLMGASLPLFCQEFLRDRSGFAGGVGWIYGLNTLGAAAGCVATGWWLLPGLGMQWTIGLGALLNVIVGFSARRLGGAGSEPVVREQPPGEPASPASPTRGVILLVLVFLTGFVGLGDEVVWTRFVALTVHNTVHTYTLTLAVVLLGIVIGSFVMGRFLEGTSRRPWIFGWFSVLGGLAVVGLLRAPAALWRDTATAGGQPLLVGALMLFPAILMGASFPLAVRLAVDRPDQVGAGVGRMAAANTAGGIVGSLVVGFAVLPTWGLSVSVQLVTGIAVVTGVMSWMLLDRTTRLGSRALASLLSLGAWMAWPALTETRLPADYLAPRDELVAFREGLDAPIAVVDRSGRKMLEIDRLWQGEDRKNHQIVAAHLPMLLHPDPRQVLVIGVGGGQTPARFLMHGVEQVTCVDIQSGLFDVLREHFQSDWMDDPRVLLREADGRSVLAHVEQQWDLVSIEVGQTFRPGVASFYTAEFYRLARERLAPRGLVSQFVPIAFLKLPEFRSMVATFLSELPHSALFFNTTELLLVGRADEPLVAPASRLEVLTKDPAVHADLALAYWGGEAYHLNRPEILLGSFLMGSKGLAELTEGAALFVDDRPTLEYSTAERAAGTVQGDEAGLASLLLDHLEDGMPLFEPELAADVREQAAAVRRANLRDVPAHILCRKATRLQGQERFAESIEMAERALAINAESLLATRLLAFSLNKVGRAAEALQQYSRAVAFDGTDLDLRLNLGMALLQAGRFVEAIEHLTRALGRKTTTADAVETLVGLGAALVEAGRLDEALERFDQALDLLPDHADARMNRAVCLSALGDDDGAIEMYRQVVALDPDRTDALYNLGSLLSRQGSLDEAVQVLQRVLALQPDMSSAHVNLGNALSGLGRSEQAIEHFETAARLAPALLQAHFNAAVLTSRLGRPLEAEAGLRRALNIAPDFGAGHLELGRVLYLTGRESLSLEHFRTALELMPASPQAAACLTAALGGQTLPAP